MPRCDQCQRDVAQKFEVTVYDESEDLSRYSVVDEIYAWYTGEVTLQVCSQCFVLLTGNPSPKFESPQNLFLFRTLQSNLSAVIAASLFEYCGYQVRHSGYEYSVPEWLNSLKAGDPNPAAARIRVMPDLKVYDRELNSIYEVEIKTTKQASSRWSYRKDQIDTIWHYHREAILMVYVQPEHIFYAQRMDMLNWGDVATYTSKSHVFYEVNLQSMFLEPTLLFVKMTPEKYYPFLKRTEQILGEFV